MHAFDVVFGKEIDLQINVDDQPVKGETSRIALQVTRSAFLGWVSSVQR